LLSSLESYPFAVINTADSRRTVPVNQPITFIADVADLNSDLSSATIYYGQLIGGIQQDNWTAAGGAIPVSGGGQQVSAAITFPATGSWLVMVNVSNAAGHACTGNNTYDEATLVSRGWAPCGQSAMMQVQVQ
jgi:hypothetical protein